MTLNAEPRAVATGSVQADSINRLLCIECYGKGPVAIARDSALSVRERTRSQPLAVLH